MIFIIVRVHTFFCTNFKSIKTHVTIYELLTLNVRSIVRPSKRSIDRMSVRPKKTNLMTTQFTSTPPLGFVMLVVGFFSWAAEQKIQIKWSAFAPAVNADFVVRAVNIFTIIIFIVLYFFFSWDLFYVLFAFCDISRFLCSCLTRMIIMMMRMLMGNCVVLDQAKCQYIIQYFSYFVSSFYYL